jgi:uncharacterized protein YndB with AHSA1/START domain
LISAQRTVSHPPDRVFEFLSDLRNHWRLEEHAFLELDEVGERSGVIRLTGPFGVSRTVRTEVLEAQPVTRMAGRAELPGGTVGLVAWEIRPVGGGSHVTLSAEVASASLPDRTLLALGGRAWLRRLFDRVLANLETAL